MTRDQRIATSVDKETKQQFRVEAAKRDMDMSELLRELVEKHLEEKQTEGNRIAVPATA